MTVSSDNDQELAAAAELLKTVADKLNDSKELGAKERLNSIVNLKNAYYTFLGAKEKVSGILNPNAGAHKEKYNIKVVDKKTGKLRDMRPSERQKANDVAVNLINNMVERGVFDEDGRLIGKVEDHEREILAKYTGSGGNLKSHKGSRGSKYEYYTPVEVASAVWDMFKDVGFSGGEVLDPCAGTGIFGATAPESAGITAVELDRISGMVNAAVLGETQDVTVSNFEKRASVIRDGTFDAVVANVPFGGKNSRGRNLFDDAQHQDKTLSGYFVIRSLEKIKAGGMGAFVVPPGVVTGQDSPNKKLRLLTSELAEFLGAIRLPNATFLGSGADTITDVIFYKKYTDEQVQKVIKAKEVGQAAKLFKASNVYWNDYTSGKYFEKRDKNILGTFVEGDGSQYNQDRVELPSGMGTDQIPKLMREAAGRIDKSSRIDWSMFNHIEIEEDTANTGDTRYINGETQQFDGTEWISIKSNANKSEHMETLAKMQSPLEASYVSGEKARDAIAYARMSNSEAESWWIAFEDLASKMAPSNHNDLWYTVCIALSVEEALKQTLQDGTSRATANEVLTERMPKAALYNKALKLEDKSHGQILSALGALKKHCGTVAKERKNGEKSVFSDSWLMIAEVAAAEVVEAPTGKNLVDNLMYKHKSQWLLPDDIKNALGEDVDISPAGGWCWNAEGKVCRIEDYFVGSLATFYEKIDKEIDSVKDSDPTLANSLRTQKDMARSKCKVVSLDNLTFGMRSPLVSPEDKVQFLQARVDSNSTYTAEGNYETRPEGGSSKWTDWGRIISRVGVYINKGSANLGGIGNSFEGITKEQALTSLAKLILTKNTEFNVWVRGNKKIMAQLEERANDPKNLRFERVRTTEATSIAGLKPSLSLHAYQSAYVRSAGREFSGINAFDVGLGKTFTALATAQHVQNIGAKNRTVFVVPSAVLGNWHAEASKAYESLNDCFFVGLTTDKNGKAVTKSSLYDDHLDEVMANSKYRKIFMTAEAFERIRFDRKTAEDFSEYLGLHHVNYDANVISTDDVERADKQKEDVIEALLKKPTSKAPYIEQMGIDSIIIDEAHIYKNSINLKREDGAKLLPLTKSSARGMDAQAKAWYIRNGSPKNDGVILLTATPVTNSPLEIYSMLSLATSHEAVNASCLGVHGGDEFIDNFCDIAQREIETLTGEFRLGNLFTGLNNAEVLSKLLDESVIIETAETVEGQIIVPEMNEIACEIDLPPDLVARLDEIKEIYIIANKSIKKEALTPEESDKLFEALGGSRVGDPLTEDLLGHPFNLMTKFIKLISDSDLLDERSTYITETPKDAERLIAAWNKKRPIETRMNRAGVSDANFIQKVDTVKLKTINNDGTNTRTEVKVFVTAFSDEPNTVSINSVNGGNQDALEALAASLEIKLDATVPPKLATLIKNVQAEEAHPRGIVEKPNPDGEDGKDMTLPFTKQIIFSDMIGQHNKIRLLLETKCNIPKDQIVIITGQRNNSPEAIQDIQDNFNSNTTGGEGQYRIIIANEKAEVGINLQKGTQAVHHLTVGWTPDSLQQRNGRGVRQGNKTEQVTVYHYDATGTFDKIRRNTVNAKADWIGSLLTGGDNGRVDISGGMTTEQQRALIDSMGDEEGMLLVQKAQKEEEEKTKAEDAKRTKTATTNIARSMLRDFQKGADEYAEEILTNKVAKTNKSIKAIRAASIRKNNRQPLDIAALKDLLVEFSTYVRAAFPNDYWSTLTGISRVISGDVEGLESVTGIEIRRVRSKLKIELIGAAKKAIASTDVSSYFSRRPSDYGSLINNEIEKKRLEARDSTISAMDAYVKLAKDEVEKAVAIKKAEKVIAAVNHPLDGSEPADERNNTVFIADKIFSRGDLFLSDDGQDIYLLHLIKDNGDLAVRFSINGQSAEERTIRTMEFDHKKLLTRMDVVHEGMPRHEELLKRLADIDENALSNHLNNGGRVRPTYFSDVWHPVNEYRKPKNEVTVKVTNELYTFIKGLTPSTLIVDWWSHLNDPFCAEMAKQNAVLRDKYNLVFKQGAEDKTLSFNWTLGYEGVTNTDGSVLHVTTALLESELFQSNASGVALSMIPQASQAIAFEAALARDVLRHELLRDWNMEELVGKINDIFSDPQLKSVLGNDSERIAMAILLSKSKRLNSLSAIKAVFDSFPESEFYKLGETLSLIIANSSRITGYQGNELTLGGMIDILKENGKIELEPYVEPPAPPANFVLLSGKETKENMWDIKQGSNAAHDSEGNVNKQHFMSMRSNGNAKYGCKFFSTVRVDGGVIENAWLTTAAIMSDVSDYAKRVQSAVAKGSLIATYVNVDDSGLAYKEAVNKK